MKLFCIVFFIVVLICMLYRNKGTASMYNGVLIGGLIYYGIVPLISEIYKSSMEYSYTYYLNMDTYSYIFTYMYITAFFCIFFISSKGYILNRSYVYVANENKLSKYMKLIGYSSLILGGISLLLFFKALGGLSSALSIAEQARSFAISLTDFMPYFASLLVIPARLVTVAPFCFWVLIYLNGRKGKIRYQKYMLLSIVLAALFYLFNAGRAPILAMILCFVVPVMKNMKIKHAWLYTFIIGIAAMPLLDVLDQLFVYMQKGTFDMGETDYLHYLNQFTYPINNAFHAFDIGRTFGFRWGRDFVTAVLDFVPGLSFEPSYIPTSAYIGGPHWHITGGTPNDIITLSILEFHIFGFLIVPFVLGKISKFADEFIRGCPSVKAGRVLATVVAVYSFLMVANADPYAIFRAFILWLTVLSMMLSKSRQKKY